LKFIAPHAGMVARARRNGTSFTLMRWQLRPYRAPLADRLVMERGHVELFAPVPRGASTPGDVGPQVDRLRFGCWVLDHRLVPLVAGIVERSS
jgi:hypothetical protein